MTETEAGRGSVGAAERVTHLVSIHGNSWDGYRPRCTCGWKSDYPMKYDAHAEGIADMHLMEAKSKRRTQ